MYDGRETTVPPDRIVIRGLTHKLSIGVHEFEKRSRQDVVFDIEISAVAGYADIVRRTGRYISYADTVEFIQGIADGGEHIELVEVLAERIADFALRNPLVAAIKVEVSKPEIFENAAGVGVVITRTQQSAIAV